MGNPLGKLIKWLITMLVIVMTGTIIGWTIPIVVAAVPPWGWIVAFMVGALALFKFAVWAIGESDYT